MMVLGLVSQPAWLQSLCPQPSSSLSLITPVCLPCTDTLCHPASPRSFPEPALHASASCNSSEFPLAKCSHPFRYSLKVSSSVKASLRLPLLPNPSQHAERITPLKAWGALQMPALGRMACFFPPFPSFARRQPSI